MDRKALQQQALRKELEDEKLPAWRRYKIMRRLGIAPTLDAAWLVPPLTQDKHRQLADYLEAVEQSQSGKSLSPALAATRALVGFSATLDDGFADYTDAALEANGDADGLLTERTETLAALRLVELDSVATEIEDVWRRAKVSEKQLKGLRNKYWDEAFRADLLSRVNKVVQAHRQEFERVASELS